MDLRCSVDAATHGCWLLMALCYKHPANQEQVSKGGVTLVLKLIADLVVSERMDTQTATLCAYAAGVLASVAEGSNANCEVIREGRGITILLQALERCMQFPHVVANACVAVTHLSYMHEPSQKEARSQGGVLSILRALMAFRGNGPVQGSICRVIAALSEGSCSSQQAFLAARLPDGDRETSAVSLLFQALRDLPQDSALVTTASWALSNLVLDSPEVVEHVCTIRGPETLVPLLRDLAGQDRTCEYLCRLVCRLCSGNCLPALRSRFDLRALGAEKVLRQIERQHQGSEGSALMHAKEALDLLRG